jgi:hypothetical protein
MHTILDSLQALLRIARRCMLVRRKAARTKQAFLPKGHKERAHVTVARTDLQL